MNILIMTNTYKPILGGLEKYVELFAKEYRKRGHRVIIVAPKCKGIRSEEDVIRIPAVENFNGTNFSLQLPAPGVLREALGEFHPDIVHSQHPFLVGDTALRMAFKYNVPLVFTQHTLYEQNVHYMTALTQYYAIKETGPIEEALKRFMIELSTGYAHLADCVFAPSESVMQMMRDRGVQTPIHVVPTGVYVKNFMRGAGKGLRKKLHIPSDAFVVGYIGRLVPEMNLEFLARGVAAFMKKSPDVHFLIGGQGPLDGIIRDIFTQAGLRGRLHLAGVFKGKELAGAYHAMDVFVFASPCETQDMVLDEAMASSVPVVAVDAPGVREVVQDRENGRLLARDNIGDFVSGLEWVQKRSSPELRKIKTTCRQTAGLFSMDKSVQKALEVYSSLCIQGFIRKPIDQSYWESKVRLMKAQWGQVRDLTKAAGVTISKMVVLPNQGNGGTIERF